MALSARSVLLLHPDYGRSEKACDVRMGHGTGSRRVGPVARCLGDESWTVGPELMRNRYLGTPLEAEHTLVHHAEDYTRRDISVHSDPHSSTQTLETPRCSAIQAPGAQVPRYCRPKA